MIFLVTVRNIRLEIPIFKKYVASIGVLRGLKRPSDAVGA